MRLPQLIFPENGIMKVIQNKFIIIFMLNGYQLLSGQSMQLHGTFTNGSTNCSSKLFQANVTSGLTASGFVENDVYQLFSGSIGFDPFIETSVFNSEIRSEFGFILKQNYPNPFNPSTKIEYDVKMPCQVHLFIYNLNGQIVKEPVHSYQPPGRYLIDLNMQGIPSGLYFLKIRMDDFQAVRKMVKIE